MEPAAQPISEGGKLFLQIAAASSPGIRAGTDSRQQAAGRQAAIYHPADNQPSVVLFV